MAVLNTPRLGLPYPDGNDLLRDGDNRIHDLAAALDDSDMLLTPAEADGAYAAIDHVHGATGNGVWEWRAPAQSPTDPLVGRMGVDNDSPALATHVYMSERNQAAIDMSGLIGSLRVDDVIYMQHTTNANSWHRYELTGTPVDHTTWWDIPVTTLAGSAQGTEPPNNALIYVQFNQQSSTAGGGLPVGGSTGQVLTKTSGTDFATGWATPSAGTQTRTSTTYTSGSLAAGGAATGTITLANAWRAYTITTTRPARVRLYDTTGHQSADAARPVGTDPAGNHGCLLEFVTTASLLSATLSPLVDGFDGKTTPDGSIPISVTNLDTVTGTVGTTITWIRTE